MKVKEFAQKDMSYLKGKNYDAFLVASGYESRASFLAKNLALDRIKHKEVFGFDSYTEAENRENNDQFFFDNSFNFIDKVSGDDGTQIVGLLDSLIKSIDKEIIEILIDYSSMTRIWYGAIINHMHISNYNKTVKIVFSYSEAKNNPPSEDSETMNFAPISKFCNISIPSKPTALITGLGYEKKRVLGLKEYFDAEVEYYFYTADNSYTDEILKRNKELIDSTEESKIFPYTIKDVLLTKIYLNDLCESLGREFRVILAPCGPKPFTLVSFIVSKAYDFIDVWRISSGDSNLYLDREANGDIIAIELTYI